MTRKIFVLRHGQTQFNSERKLQGHCDSPLTELGAAQAKRVGATLKEHLEGRDFSVYASPLGRTIQTAHIVCEQINHSTSDVIHDPRLKEFFLGLWEERAIVSLAEEFPDLMADRDWLLKAPQSETYDAVKSRLLDWLSEAPATEDLVVVSHGLTGIVLRGILLDMSYKDVWNQDLPQDAFFVIQEGTLTRVEC